MLKRLLLFVWMPLFFCSLANAATPEPEQESMTVEEFVASLNFQQGVITLPGKMATLNIPDTFRYLDPADTERVLVLAWGNPSGEGTLGMLFPADATPVSENSWGVVITYEEDGYVSDKDADTINYDELLQEMKDAVVEENNIRRDRGYESIELVGWAERPYYDKADHKLYWAKEIAFGLEEENTLNYNIRVLGRKGVLNLNAVSSIGQLDTVKEGMTQVLSFAEFNPGYRYMDYDSKTDKTAAYGLAALVAGGVAAKAGLFTKLFGVLLAAKKLVIAGLIALGTFFTRIVKKRG